MPQKSSTNCFSHSDWFWEQACSAAAGASDEMTDEIAGSIMSGSAKESTIENMGCNGDYVGTPIGGGVEAGTDTKFWKRKSKGHVAKLYESVQK